MDIFFYNPFDPGKGGQLEKDVVPDEIGFYAENIYFPLDGLATQVTYEYIVWGSGANIWKVTVALDDGIVEQNSGVGDMFFISNGQSCSSYGTLSWT